MKMTSFYILLVCWTLCGVTGSREREQSTNRLQLPLLNVSIQVDSPLLKRSNTNTVPKPVIEISEPLRDSEMIGGLSSNLIILSNCVLEKGYCMTANGGDQNNGVVKLDSLDGFDVTRQAQCLKKCAEISGWTGCEMIWHRSDKGCYAHTRPVSRGNGGGDYYCWVQSKCNDLILTTVSPPTTKKAHINLDGTKWDWYHNGKTKNGEVEFTAEDKVKWNGGNPHGSWRINDEGQIVTVFNGITHILRLNINGYSAVLIQPSRDPPSKMVLQNPTTTIDVCSQCHKHATCNSEDGSRSCVCERGFTGTGLQCTDINECDQNPCSHLAQCRNFDGSFSCGECPDGYRGDGTNCVEEVVAVWQTTQFIIKEQTLNRSNLLATIDNYLEQFVVSFSFKPKSIHTNWHNVIQFTIGTDVRQYGDRIPGVYMMNGFFHICSAVNKELNHCFNTKKYNTGRWIDVKIQQVKHDGSYKYSLRTDDKAGKVSTYSVMNDKAQIFKNVKVYASSPWYPPQPGEIKNFQIYRTVQVFTSSKWSCPRNDGQCLSSNNQKLKLDKLDGSDETRASACLEKCLAYPGATGCEMRWNGEDRGCYVHTDVAVQKGSGGRNAYCWVLKFCQGAMPMLIGNFENHLYDGTSQKNDLHYVHISYNTRGKYYTWENKRGDKWKLFRTSKINELRVERESLFYNVGHTLAKFTKDGVYGPSNQFYKRAGLEFVGTWSATFSNKNVATYNFTDDGTMQRDLLKWKTQIVASRSNIFPAEDGWFQTYPGLPEATPMEYLRVSRDGTMEIRHFCTSSKSCSGTYKGIANYCCHAKAIKHRWMLQQQNVCFGAKSSQYGRFYTKYQGKLSAVKLVHRSGHVGCHGSARSNWGCSNKKSIGIAITNVQNKVLFPNNLPSDGWYQLSPYTIDSPEIILTNPTQDYRVSKNQQLRIWYGEDLRNYTESNNQGKACVDVYLMITEEIQTSTRPAPYIGAVYTINEPWNPQYAYQEVASDFVEGTRTELKENEWNAYIRFETFLRKELMLILNKTMPTIPSKEYLIHISYFKKSSTGFTIVNSNIRFLGSNDTMKKRFCTSINRAMSGITKIGNYTVLGKIEVGSKQGCCLPRTYGDDSFKGKYEFPTGLAGDVLTLPCKYSSTVSLTSTCVVPTNLAPVGGDHVKEVAWMAPDLSKCHSKSKTTMELGVLNVTSHCNTTGTKCDTSTELSTKLNKIVPDAKAITTPTDLSYIASITSVVVKEFNATDAQNVTENILQTMGTVIDSEPTYLVAAETKDTAATSLLKDVESFSKKLGNTLDVNNGNITVSKKNIALQVAKVSKKSSNVKITSRLAGSNDLSVGLEKDSESETSSDFLASLDLSNSSQIRDSDTVIYSQAYLKSTLFVSKEQVEASKEGREYLNPVQSLILAVSLSKNTASLKNPAIIKFKKIYNTESESYCRFWQFGKGKEPGSWNDTGCVRVTIPGDDSSIVTCSCSHLTNFALLLDVYQTGSNPLVLSYISFIGCGISLAGLILTIVIFTYFRNLRSKLPSKILVCLCISLTILLIIFLAGVETASSNRTACQVVAGLLQYFLLASFMWMCVAAVNLYQLLVKIFRSGSTGRFFLRASIIAWGLPVIITVITGAVGPDYMGNDTICFPQKNAMYFGVLLPILIILVINFIILIIILVKFARKMPVGDQTEQKHNMCQVRVAFSISILLGLGWILSLFANQEAEFIFQLLFCIFNSLQGFFIFILYTFTNESVRKEFSRMFSKSFGGSAQNTTSTAASSSRDDFGKSTSKF